MHLWVVSMLLNGIAKYQFSISPITAMLALGILGTGYAYIWNFQILAAAISQGRFNRY